MHGPRPRRTSRRKASRLARASDAIRIYLETGAKRTFAGAIDWPGWCRSGRDENSAVQALVEYGPRYARALRPAKLGFAAPTDVSAFEVMERLRGSATTDFGAPGEAPADDSRPVPGGDLRRYEAILRACWQTLDEAADVAAGKRLRKGPRGGGRDLAEIVNHVLEGDRGYLRSLGWKVGELGGGSVATRLGPLREEILRGLKEAAAGRIPRRGPRGGRRWTARYFVRRLAWHTLDHAWEIQDRVV